MTVRHLLLTLLLLASFLVWRWFDTANKPELLRIIDPSRPDFIAKNLYSVAFDDNGKLSYRIFADAMTHFEQQKQTLFDHPVVLVYPEEIRPIWQLTANSGVLRGKVGGTMKASNVDTKSVSDDELEPAVDSSEQDEALTNKGNLLTVSLNDDVKIVNLTNNEYVKQITSSNIELDIKDKKIHTQAKVFIEGPTYDLQGVGLIGDLSLEQVDLLEDVHGIYHQ